MSDTRPPARAESHGSVCSLAWPMVLAGISTPLVGAVDTAIMGRLPDPAYLGAVAVGATMFNAIYWMFGFLRMGTTGLAAQSYGRGNADELVAVACRAGGLALLLGVALVSCYRPLLDLTLWLLEASTEVEALAGSYYQVRLWGVPAVLLNLVVLGMLFGLQRMYSVLLIGVLLNLSNLSLDVLFVVGLGWDVQGVAAGTAVSEWLAGSVGVSMLVRHLRRLGGRRVPWSVLADRSRLRGLFRVSTDLLVRSFFVQLPFVVFTALGATFGNTVLAANAALMQLFFFMAFGLNSFAHVAETLAGHAFGAGDPDRLRAATRHTFYWSLAFAAAVSTIYALAGGAIIDLLTDLDAVRSTARAYLPWIAAAPLAAVGAFHLDGVFIGTTRTRYLRNTMMMAVAGYLATLWAALDALGNHGLWLAMIVFMSLRAGLLAGLYPRLAFSVSRR